MLTLLIKQSLSTVNGRRRDLRYRWGSQSSIGDSRQVVNRFNWLCHAKGYIKGYEEIAEIPLSQKGN